MTTSARCSAINPPLPHCCLASHSSTQAGGVGVARSLFPPSLVATGASVFRSRRVSLILCLSSGVWNPRHRKDSGHRERNPGNPTRHRQHRARDGCDMGLLR
ncbi:hypothetical protein E2C01_099784 [Portunus trituberculatus]|uniref:Uncharacterized protein n=1 Tax=Portunus trituberculatus TaxID=210409 RepID=A0A5B7K6E5_PORTR|nr:hypothetical protein [Portunus trituberculatus]